MKLTKVQLRNMIQEEINKVIPDPSVEEAYDWLPGGSQASKMQKAVSKSQQQHFGDKGDVSSELDKILIGLKNALLNVLQPQVAENVKENTEEVVEEEEDTTESTEE